MGEVADAFFVAIFIANGVTIFPKTTSGSQCETSNKIIIKLLQNEVAYRIDNKEAININKIPIISVWDASENLSMQLLYFKP
jgi:hypothetical protein